MKKLLLAVVACLGLIGCVEPAYADYMTPVYGSNNCYEYHDDYGVRTVCNVPTYVMNGNTFYWDHHFGAWIGSGGYLRGGRFYRGYYPGYRGVYGHGYYHGGGYSHGGGGHFGGHGGGHGHR